MHCFSCLSSCPPHIKIIAPRRSEPRLRSVYQTLHMRGLSSFFFFLNSTTAYMVGLYEVCSILCACVQALRKEAAIHGDKHVQLWNEAKK